jgi:hypothetical protein
MSLPYIETDFISSSECQRLVDFAIANKSPNVVNHDEEYSTDVEWIDHGATYYGNNVDPVTVESDDTVVVKVTDKCKTFADCELTYVGVVRWPVGTFMKPHVDTNTGHKENILAAMLYLNDGFEGGNLIFQDLVVEPEPGKLIIFSNTEDLHYVNRVEGSERFALSFWYNKP